jgi:hypothetical protein
VENVYNFFAILIRGPEQLFRASSCCEIFPNGAGLWVGASCLLYGGGGLLWALIKLEQVIKAADKCKRYPDAYNYTKSCNEQIYT